MFAIAGVYGKYDSYRVKDKTAHQALMVLQQTFLLNMSEKDQNKLMKSVEKQFRSGSAQLTSICKAIQNVGIPKYYPRYMIQHGIQAFTENEGNGLIQEFNSVDSWNQSLQNYLHCE